MGSYEHRKYLKGEFVRKKFLKENDNWRNAQRKRQDSIFAALCDALTINPDISDHELIKIAKHIDRVVNSQRMRSNSKQKHREKYKHQFTHPQQTYSQLGMNTCYYKVTSKQIIIDSRPFTTWAYKYIIKELMEELNNEE